MTTSCCEGVARSTSSPEGVVLRVMKASDLPHVRALHRNLLPVSYPAAFFVQLLIHPRQLCLVATDHGTIIGFASAAMGPSQSGSGDLWGASSLGETLADRSHMTLLTLGVLPAYQRRGIGRSLVHGVVQRLEASCAAAAQSESTDQEGKTAVLVRVQVARSNAAGRCFYARLGMMDQWANDDLQLCLGPRSATSVMAGVLCV